MDRDLEHIRRRLKEEGQKTVAFFEALDADEWELQIYTTGSGWRAREILAHFISAERAYQRYLGKVLKGGSGPPNDMDIDQFNESDVPTYKGISIGNLLDTYQETRLNTIHLTTQMEDDDLLRMANHPWFGEKEVGWYLKLLYRHNTMHCMDIRKAIKLGKAVPHN